MSTESSLFFENNLKKHMILLFFIKKNSICLIYHLKLSTFVIVSNK